MRISTIAIYLTVASALVLLCVDRSRAGREVEELRAALQRLEHARPATGPTIYVPAVRGVPSNSSGQRNPQVQELAAPPSHAASMAEARSGGADRTPLKPPSPVEEFAPIRELFEDRYEREQTDSSWAGTARSRIEAVLSSRMPSGSRIEAVDCRSSLCRIRAIYESESQMNEFINNSFAEPSRRPWNGSFAVGPIEQSASGGRVTMLAFLMREGARLPSTHDSEEP